MQYYAPLWMRQEKEQYKINGNERKREKLGKHTG